MRTVLATTGPSLAPKAALPIVSMKACGLGSDWYIIAVIGPAT